MKLELNICIFFLQQEDLNKANEDQIQRKIVKQEQEKVEEQKVIEYMKQKAVCNLILIMCQKKFIHQY